METGEKGQAKFSSALPRLNPFQPTLEPLLSGRILLRKGPTPFRLSSRYMLPSNTIDLLHRMTNSNAYALSSAGHRIM